MKWLKLTLTLVFTFAMIMLVLPKKPQRQAQEEQARSALVADSQPVILEIKMPIESENDAQVADILWIQKAAEIAMEQGSPWFNVIDSRISSNDVTGRIQLEEDPMAAEYDANEILSLHLSDETP